MDGRDFAHALQFRSAHWPTDLTYCTCGFSFATANDTHNNISNYSHLLTCRDNTYTYIGRHEEIVSSLICLLTRYGFATKWEPRDCHGEEDEKRPDVTIFTPKICPVIDVSVVTNTCQSYYKMTDPAAHIVSQKDNKHRENVEKIANFKFYAIVTETSGRCHGHIDGLARYLQQFVDTPLRAVFRKELACTLSTSSMRGTARIIGHAMDRLRTSKIFGHPKCF